MDFVTVEIDIQPDGSIKAEPNPVGAATGDVLRIHVRGNGSDKEKIKVKFKGGPATGHVNPVPLLKGFAKEGAWVRD